MKHFFSFIILTFVLSASNVYAQDVSVEAQVNTKKTDLQSAIQLSIKVNGKQDVLPVSLPQLDGFDVRYVGPSKQVFIVNGQYSSSVTFNYTLFPKTIGQFQIPALDIEIDGQTYQMQAIDVEVMGSEDLASSLLGGQGAGDLSEKLFVNLSIPNNEVYLNQKVPLKIMLFVSDVSIRDIQFPQFEEVGFTLGEMKQPKQYSQVIKGVSYDIVEFNVDLYPTRTGKLNLGPATVDLNMLYRNQRDNRSSRRIDSIFNDDFFGEFFDRYEKRPIQIESDEKMLTVLALPQEGKPRDFSGAVGNYNFRADASPRELNVGDPITVRMLIEGKGSLTHVDFPQIKDKRNFKTYEPTIKEKEGAKLFEQVVIPLSDKVGELPEFNFHYFDPDLKQYRTITKGPFILNVSPSEDGEASIVGLGLQEEIIEPEEALGRDIVFIKERIGKLKPIDQTLTSSLMFKIILGLLGVIWIVLVVVVRRIKRLETDVAFAKRLHAPKQAKKHLAQARKLLKPDQNKAFYDMIFKTLQSYFANKLHIPTGAVSYDRLCENVKIKKADATQLNTLKGLFDVCDQVRFAAKSLSEDDMKVHLTQLEEIIDYMERNIK